MANHVNSARGAVQALAFVWDVPTLKWVPETQPGGGGGGGGAMTVADGADVTQGALADAKVTGDSAGTLSGKLRGLTYYLGLVTDTVNSWLKVSIQNASLAVTQSGIWSFSLIPKTSGGLTNYHAVATGTNADKANIKASAGQLYGVTAFNNTSYPVFVKLHNTAAVPTPGAGVVFTVGVQAGVARDIVIPNGLTFSTGIGITMVTGLADADSTNLAASDCVVDINYA